MQLCKQYIYIWFHPLNWLADNTCYYDDDGAASSSIGSDDLLLIKQQKKIIWLKINTELDKKLFLHSIF